MKKENRRLPLLVRRLRSVPALVFVALLVAGGVSATIVRADSFQDQINQLDQQNAQSQSTINSLQLQASNYQDAINKLQQQISAVQNAIAINQAKQAQLQQQITDDQAKLDQEKKVLGDDLKAMYVGGQMSTVEMLATSKNLSDFVDAETYDSAVQTKVQDTLTQIAKLQNQLEDQKTQVSQLLAVQQQQNSQLTSDQSQQQQLLAYNQGQQAAYNAQVTSNQEQIATLRAEQAAANRRLDSSGQVISSGSCGGSYPATASGPYGNWGCDYPLDGANGNLYDNWGMGNRECVSYTAWMVYKTYGYMPYWGGVGNANEWPGDARAAGIPIGSTPKVGSVAIYMGGAGDPFGHAMWVVGVSGDQIHVYSYNDNYDGNFYDHWVNASGLTYIYFGN